MLALGRHAQVVNLHDVLVRQRSVNARLGEQHANEALVGSQMRQDALDGHRLLEALFAKGSAHIQLGHIADGEAVEELVLSESHRGQFHPGIRPIILAPGFAGLHETQPQN